MNINKIKTIYDSVWKAPQNQGLFVSVKDQMGLVDRKGNVHIQPKYDSLKYLGNNLFSYQLNKKLDIITSNGIKKSKPIYDNILPFENNLAIVEINDKFGYIDILCNIVCPIIYHDIKPFTNGLSRVRLESKFGYIDQQFKIVIQFKYEVAHNFINEYAIVAKEFFNDNSFGFINKCGEEIIPLIYEYDDLDKQFKKYIRKIKIKSLL